VIGIQWESKRLYSVHDVRGVDINTAEIRNVTSGKLSSQRANGFSRGPSVSPPGAAAGADLGGSS
jgi:hypothetical protein